MIGNKEKTISCFSGFKHNKYYNHAIIIESYIDL